MAGALFVIALVSAVLQIVAGVLVYLLMTEHDVLSSDNSWVQWVATFVPLYVFAIPLGLLLMRRVPAEAREPSPLAGSDFLTFLLMCFPILYGGNLIGTVLSLLLSSGTAENGLLEYANETSIVKVVVMVVLAPLIEEFVFRKQIIDRCGRYGEKTAILFSALTFGLFHMNLYQFFYAFGLGLIFAYVYTRTRRLRDSFALHAIINCVGSVVAPWVMSLLDTDALEQLKNAGEDAMEILRPALPGLLLFLVYVLALFVLSMIGLVLLIVKRKNLIFFPASAELPREHRARTVYCNAGFLVFLLFCLAMCVMNLL
jgi:membrane protease YdiL (CAAX protease family)